LLPALPNRLDARTGCRLSKRQLAPLVIAEVEKLPEGRPILRRIIRLAAAWVGFHRAENEFEARATVHKIRDVLQVVEEWRQGRPICASRPSASFNGEHFMGGARTQLSVPGYTVEPADPEYFERGAHPGIDGRSPVAESSTGHFTSPHHKRGTRQQPRPAAPRSHRALHSIPRPGWLSGLLSAGDLLYGVGGMSTSQAISLVTGNHPLSLWQQAYQPAQAWESN
jgi:hypothetical protein